MNPASGELSRDGETVRLEVRTMRLLVCLAERAGDVVSIDDLLKQVWPDVVVSSDSVYQAVASLRRALGDDPKQPTYIATVPRLGYRMIAAVRPWPDQPAPPADAPAAARMRPAFAWSAAAVSVTVAAIFFFAIVVKDRRAAVAGQDPTLQKSIAVLPFQDLTEKMAEEEFADGMTEEVIDRLGRIPGFRVPPPTSSFYFKNKRRSVADIARALNVTFVLDGSTRKSGDRLRVAARLIRADSGVVIWSDSYDRRWGDILALQDDIAGEVAKALRSSIR